MGFWALRPCTFVPSPRTCRHNNPHFDGYHHAHIPLLIPRAKGNPLIANADCRENPHRVTNGTQNARQCDACCPCGRGWCHGNVCRPSGVDRYYILFIHTHLKIFCTAVLPSLFASVRTFLALSTFPHWASVSFNYAHFCRAIYIIDIYLYMDIILQNVFQSSMIFIKLNDIQQLTKCKFV